ncbi:YeeE/YedE family protein [Rubrobacter taiwanensis]|uniref:YeeE/YedE family protein n=1 Tax=Rubrobacter taiwanensis TaxID=185139 RepID=A0A4R1BHV7_9ACTN|nr:DUF6691 family protein [Rubrobacter taiwanensis]TCJ16865.1 YeeE/YedE family protein [Rubrobacter taiwanensis]
MRIVVALISGVIFGLGLAISGMANPAKVVGFLDFFGDWDPTLALVMGGALLVAIPAFRLILRREGPVLGGGFDLPARRDIDGRLVGGAALFGLGWGISGFCPGPAVVALSSGVGAVFVFVGAMVAGMALYSLVAQRPELAGEGLRPGAGKDTRVGRGAGNGAAG